MNLHTKVFDILTLGLPSLVITDRIRDNNNIHQHWPELNPNLLEVCCVISRLIVTMSSMLGAPTAAVAAVRNKDLVSDVYLFNPSFSF